MDQLYPFNTALQTINPRTGCSGILELHPTDGEVFLFDGSLSKAECEAGVISAGFMLVANEHHPAYKAVDNNSREFTVFATEKTKGYVHITERQCKC